MTRDPNRQSWPVREGECEGRALADLAGHPDLAPMQLDKLPRQRKPEPGALVPARAGTTHLAELLEHRRLVLGGDADAGVAHGDRDLSLALAEVDRHLPAFRRELDGVREQIQDDLPHLSLVSDHLTHAPVGSEGEPDAVPGGALAHEAETAFEGSRQVEGAQLQLHLPRLDLGEIKDVVDERQEMAARGEHVVEVFLLLRIQLAEHPLQQYLREADDRVERRAQLVRHVGQELRLVSACGLDLPVEPTELYAHPVEVPREGPELVAVRNLHAPGKSTSRDLLQ